MFQEHTHILPCRVFFIYYSAACNTRWDDLWKFTDQIKTGTVDVKFLDTTVAAMLHTNLKFLLGLFESMSLTPIIVRKISDLGLKDSSSYPYENYFSAIRTPEFRDILHRADTDSIVLFENRHTSPLAFGPQANRVSVRYHIVDEH